MTPKNGKEINKRNKYVTFFLILTVVFSAYLYSRSIPISINSRSIFQGKEFRIAHRCGRAILPENTLFACKEISRKNLVDILEMDVRLTKDNRLIVIHDESVDRTTNGMGKVSEFNYDEIKSLDAGYLYTEDGKTYPYRGQGIQILELEEFFKNLPDARYYIEIKVKTPLAANILIQLIEKYKMQNRVYIGSVSDEVNENLRRLSSGKISVFSGFFHTGKWYIAYILGFRGIVNPPAIIAIPDMPRIIPITQSFMRAVKEQNIKVHIFTINNKEQIRKFESLEIDGVMTDNPQLFNDN